MTSGTVPQDVKDYLDAVRARLDDLPAEEREDLLADVEPSILDSAEESDAPMALRLGPPETFADELRAAAGLPPRADTAERAPKRGLWQRVARADAFFASSPATRWVRELAPLWWVLRGVVLVGLVELLYGRSFFVGDELQNYALVVAAAVPLAVIASVAIGLRRPRRNVAVVLVNLALALAAVPVLWHAVGAARDAAFTDTVTVVPNPESALTGLVYDRSPVYNVFAFDPEGRLLRDVRLFDHAGRPLEIGMRAGDPNRRMVRNRDGRVVLNAFPIRYFEPRTKRVARPAVGAPPIPGPLRSKRP
jgi:hypothetical protein